MKLNIIWIPCIPLTMLVLTFQVDRMQALSAIVDRLNQEYPHTQPTLRRVTLNLSSKVAADESV